MAMESIADVAKIRCHWDDFLLRTWELGGVHNVDIPNSWIVYFMEKSMNIPSKIDENWEYPLCVFDPPFPKKRKLGFMDLHPTAISIHILQQS